jgi:hypothetical protein
LLQINQESFNLFRIRHETAVDDYKPLTAEPLTDRWNAYIGTGEKTDEFDPEAYERQAEPDRIPDYIAKPPVGTWGPWMLARYTSPGPTQTLEDVYEGVPVAQAEEFVFSGDEPDKVEITEPKIRALSFDGAKFAHGLGRAVKGLRRGLEASAAPLNLLESTSRFVTMRCLSLLHGRDRGKTGLEEVKDKDPSEKDPETKTGRKKAVKIAMGLGSVAVVAAVGVGTAYLISKGYYPHINTGRAHETLQQGLPSKAPAHPAEALQIAPPKNLETQGPLQQLLTKPKISPEHIQNVTHKAAKAVIKAKHYRESLRFSGDNMWTHIQDRIQAKHPNISHHKLIAMTAKWTNRALSNNHMSAADARQMNIGDSFEIPIQLG